MLYANCEVYEFMHMVWSGGRGRVGKGLGVLERCGESGKCEVGGRLVGRGRV